MLELERTQEIAKLKIKLADSRNQRKRAQQSAEDMEQAIKHLQKQYKNTEDGLQETENTIRKRMDTLPSGCTFRSIYITQARNKIINGKSSQALMEIQQSICTAIKKLQDKQAEISQLERQISVMEEELRQLMQQEV